jgi:inosine/xanthosine triphosphate pyrophosphatase family protein
VLFVTGHQGRFQEVRGLLADLPIRTRKLALPAHAELDALSARVAARALDAFAIVAEPCFTELARLELEGLPPLSGAAFKRAVAAEGEAAVLRRLGGRRGRARVAVAFTADGAPERVEVFEGEVEGELLTAPRGDGGYGWDRAFVPDGFRRSLGELAGAKGFVQMRARPYLELGERLRGRSDRSAFEAHVTVAAADAATVDRFVAWCDARAVKAVLIELSRGDVPSQPMTASHHHGRLAEAQAEVFALARALAADGFDVSRVKLEALGVSPLMPETDAAAAAEPANYFELHLKLRLEPGAALGPIEAACRPHGAHLSRNARKRRGDGVTERFVTLRVGGVGRPSAERRFAALVQALEDAGHRPVSRIREYTVYDSNLAVDRGWLG